MEVSSRSPYICSSLTGATKVTVTPLIGFPTESLTVACSGFGKVAPDRADCGVPRVGAMLAGWAALLVREKDVDSPAVLAVTV